MNILCVIPARGQSKRLKHKNMMPFQGRPLVDWTLDCAAKCGDLFSFIVLSSEADNILERAMSYPDVWQDYRPKELASDAASMMDVARHVYRKVESTFRYSPDAVCILPPTAPLRTPEHIRRCVKVFLNTGAECVMAVSRYNLPAWQALFLNQHGEALPYWPQMITHRGQKVPTLYCDAGSVYVVSKAHLLAGPSLYCDRMRVVEIPQWQAADIDDVNSLVMASVLAEGGEQLKAGRKGDGV